MRDNEDVNQYVAQQTAMGRTGQADDIGAAVASLLSSNSYWITGQRIEASGGMLMRPQMKCGVEALRLMSLDVRFWPIADMRLGEAGPAVMMSASGPDQVGSLVRGCIGGISTVLEYLPGAAIRVVVPFLPARRHRVFSYPDFALDAHSALDRGNGDEHYQDRTSQSV